MTYLGFIVINIPQLALSLISLPSNRNLAAKIAKGILENNTFQHMKLRLYKEELGIKYFSNFCPLFLYRIAFVVHR